MQNPNTPFWAQANFDPWAGCPETFLAARMVRVPQAPTRMPMFAQPASVRQFAPGLSSSGSTGMRPQGAALYK
jgi:hypothetical protein